MPAFAASSPSVSGAARRQPVVGGCRGAEGTLPATSIPRGLTAQPTTGRRVSARANKARRSVVTNSMAKNGGNKVFLVTGSTDGIGLFTARKLAASGADVIIHGRSPERVAQAKELVTQASAGKGKVYDYAYDFSSLQNVRQLAADVRRDHGSIDVLINNAGVYMEEKQISEEGFEMTYAVNVLAPFTLTANLHNAVRSRIVNTASLSAGSRVDFDNLNQEKGFSSHGSYSLSKLCNIIFTFELAEREASRSYTVNTLDPGTVNTKMLMAGWGSIGIPVESADNELHLATCPELEGVSGEYFVSKSSRRAPSEAYNKELRQKLWSVWEEQTGDSF